MKIRDGFMSRPKLLVGLGGPACAAPAALAVRALLAPRLTTTTQLSRRRAIWCAGANRRCRGDRPAGIALPAARTANLRPVAQTVGAVDHHLVADRQPLD